MNKAATMRTAGLTLGALVLVAASGFIGFGIGDQARGAAAAGGSSVTSSRPCNLRVTWDSASQTHMATYDAPVFSSSETSYGRIADLSCTDAEILEWRDARVAAGLDAQVCRPVLFNDTVTGRVYPIGCAIPTLVVTGEPR